MRIYTLIFFVLIIVKARAQQKVLTIRELSGIIKKYHPLGRQAALDIRLAKAAITSSRGAFDPKLRIDNSRKNFDGILYYDHRVNEIIIPTWYGIDLFAGTEKISGNRINPEETKGSLNYLGVSMPLVRNFVMDKRRAQLQQAKTYHLLSEVQRQAVLNNLLKDAFTAYWDWWQQHEAYLLLQSVLHNAEKRLEYVRTGFLFGDRPAIDTLEALSQVQSLQLKNLETYTEKIKAKLLLSTFLWNEKDGGAEIPEELVPEEFENDQIPRLAELLHSTDKHPDLVYYNFKLQGLDIEKRLKFQLLLPDVKFKYVQTDRKFLQTIHAPWLENNYNYGISLSFPLRLSEGRGEYNQAKLKIEITKLEQANKQVQLQTKLMQYYTEWEQTSNQLLLQMKIADNVRSLQTGEVTRFTNGESSLFLVNARELKTIEMQQKLIELKAKYGKATVNMQWSAGLLGNLLYTP